MHVHTSKGSSQKQTRQTFPHVYTSVATLRNRRAPPAHIHIYMCAYRQTHTVSNRHTCTLIHSVYIHTCTFLGRNSGPPRPVSYAWGFRFPAAFAPHPPPHFPLKLGDHSAEEMTTAAKPYQLTSGLGDWGPGSRQGGVRDSAHRMGSG